MGKAQSNVEKNAKRNARKKLQKDEKALAVSQHPLAGAAAEDEAENEDDVLVEYVHEDVAALEGGEDFRAVFDSFSKREALLSASASAAAEEARDDDSPPEGEGEGGHPDEGEGRLSNRKKKKVHRLTVAELKQLVPNPALVESHDITASDPVFLVCLKVRRRACSLSPFWFVFLCRLSF